ncbi:MAG: methylenetetrahydrofolate reductase [Actinomycetota bacterium]
MSKAPKSHLESLLRAGEFVVTAELATTDSADPDSIREVSEPLKGHVDAVNCTDNSAAHPHISQVAAAHLLIDNGFEPLVQFTCRDRNRLGLQADMLGAAALGVKNIVCMQGDDVSSGDHPEAKPIWDLDSMHLIRTARVLRDEGVYLSGRKLDQPPDFFVGAVENPFAPPVDYRPIRLAKKVEAGAEFIQTQIVFNVPRMREFMSRVGDLGLKEKAYILASVCIPRSAKAARYMWEQVPGVDVPAEILERLEKTPKTKQADESIKIGLEIVEQIRGIPGVNGVHLIAINWEEAIARIVEESDLLPRPSIGAKVGSKA